MAPGLKANLSPDPISFLFRNRFVGVRTRAAGHSAGCGAAARQAAAPRGTRTQTRTEATSKVKTKRFYQPIMLA